MSKPDQNFNKVFVYILIGIVVLSSIFVLMMFGPGPNVSSDIFSTSLRYYTKGTEKLYYTDYASTIEQDIKEIGIYVEDYPMEYSTFLDNIFNQKDFELAIVELEGENAPHLETLFKDGASLNIFNFRDELDNGTTTSYIANITKAFDFYERKNTLFALQEHLMANILPMVPLFTPYRTFAYWNNLEGFSGSLGLSDSLPYMSFNGLHENQEFVNELKLGVGGWFDLNPFTVSEDAEKLLVSLIMDKLISLDTKGTPTKNGLIDNWEYLNDTTLLLHVRDSVRWQPDVDEIYPSELFTVDDIIFTLDLARSIYANLDFQLFNWIDSYEVYNSTTAAIYIDSDTTTGERDPYAFPLEDLSIYPYPEYYLNIESTIPEIVSSARWTKFRSNPFGTGKYRFNATASVVELSAELYKNTQWHGVGALDGQPTNLTFDRIEANSIPSAYSLNLDLQEGDRIDWADFGKNPAVRTAIPTNNFVIDYKRENSLVFLAFNLDNENFGGDNNFLPSNVTGVSKGLAIRKAIASIIRKTLMNDQYHEGVYNITETPISMYFSDYYNSGVTTYPYSIEDAINYLVQAGFNITLNDPSDIEDTSFSIISSVVGLGFATPVAVFITKKRKKK